MKITIAAIVAMWAGLAHAAEIRLAFPTDEELRDALRDASLTVQAAQDDASRRRDVVAAAQADYQRLLSVLYENGYFGPVISIQVDGVEAAELPTVGSETPVDTITIEIREGPRFLFGEARIGPVARGTELPEEFAPGRPAGTEPIRQAARAGVEGWRAIGHAKAEIGDQDIVARQPDRRLDARITLAPGPRLVYGPALVEGAERVRPNQISRIADLRQGRVFDPEEIGDAARRLQRTGAFASVSIVEADAIGPADTLPLTIQVVERLPRRFGVGAEISTDEGFSPQAFFLHRNLTGYADSLRIEGAVDGIGGTAGGGADYALTFAYNRPATFNPETDLFVNGGVVREDEPNFSSDRIYLESGARRIVSDEFTYSYGLRAEYSETMDALGTRQFFILSVPLDATYNRRNDDLNPSDGYYIEAGLRPFYGFERAGAGAVFDADLRGYQGFGAEDGTVIAARLQLGSVIGPDIEDTPAETLFFSGGGGTVRGQDFQSLGIDLPNGDTVGGKSFLGLSAELRRQVTESIGVVGFVDYGMISEGAGFGSGESHSGAGLGLRYNTGIGPIRLDLGFPVSGPDDRGGVAVYIGIGQAF